MLLRTPDDRFANLPDYPFDPHYTQVGGIRIHHVEAGSVTAPPVLMLHGEPSWSYLYRHMLPVIAAAGYRAVAPDLVGFGKSDKPAKRRDYTYQRHVEWMARWMEISGLHNVTLVCQDWGSLIGLRLVALDPERFDRVVVANGALPTGTGSPPLAFRLWQQFARWTPHFPAGWIVSAGSRHRLPAEVRAAYDAPFPDESYKQGARAFPMLVPLRTTDPEARANRRAWRVLRRWEKPFLTAFSDGDPITRGMERCFQELVPGAQGQPHTVLHDAGHFVQEDKGVELANIVVDFIARTS